MDGEHLTLRAPLQRREQEGTEHWLRPLVTWEQDGKEDMSQLLWKELVGRRVRKNELNHWEETCSTVR